jgi:hypothetical protein
VANKDSNEGAHWPIERQLTSAEMAEAREKSGETDVNPRLAPTANTLRNDPDLDPNVDRGGRTSTAAPARTEITREDAIASGLTAPPPEPEDAAQSSINSAGEPGGRDEDEVRKANAKKASAPGTVSNPAEQKAKGTKSSAKTKDTQSR